jgi:hypothetical protein
MKVSSQNYISTALLPGKKPFVPIEKTYHCREWNTGRAASSPSLHRLNYPGYMAKVKVPPKLEPRSGHVGFVVDKVALGLIFSECFGFPCQFSFRRLLHTHHLSSGAGTIGQLVADVNKWTESCPTPEKLTKFLRKVSEHLILMHYAVGTEIKKII